MARLAVDPTSTASALAVCHRALERRAYTAGEIRTKLRQRGYHDDVVDDAVQRCVDAQLIDDGQYAQMFVRQRLARGAGPAKIRFDLERRGVDRSLIEHAIADAVDPEALTEACVAVLTRRFDAEQLGDTAQRAKAYRHLVSRGYAAATVDAAIASVRRGE